VSLARKPFGTGGAITKAVLARCLEARDPFADGLEADAESGGDFGLGLPLDEHAAHQFGPTMRGETGILMDVHSVLRGILKLRNSSLLGLGRMDNLVKVHI
jgi:hypothetical protein